MPATPTSANHTEPWASVKGADGIAVPVHFAGRSLRELSGRPCRLHIELRNAQLFGLAAALWTDGA